MLVPPTQRQGCSEHLGETSLSFGDHSLYRGVWGELRQAEPETSILAELDHERLCVTILASAADVHHASNGYIAKRRVDQPQHGITLGWLLHP